MTTVEVITKNGGKFFRVTLAGGPVVYVNKYEVLWTIDGPIDWLPGWVSLGFVPLATRYKVTDALYSAGYRWRFVGREKVWSMTIATQSATV